MQNRRQSKFGVALPPLTEADVRPGLIYRQREKAYCFMAHWKGRNSKQRLYIGPSIDRRVALEYCEHVPLSTLFLGQDDVIVQMAEGDYVVSRLREGDAVAPGMKVIERVEGTVESPIVHRWRVRPVVPGDYEAASLALAFEGSVYSDLSGEKADRGSNNYEDDDDLYAF